MFFAPVTLNSVIVHSIGPVSFREKEHHRRFLFGHYI